MVNQKEIQDIASEIESLKSKVRNDLVEISKHFEKLGKLMKTQQESTAYLRCKGHMRIANALIHGIRNLRLGFLINDQDDDTFNDTEETTNDTEQTDQE